MAITVTLQADMEAAIRETVEGTGKSISEFVREAIAEMLARDAAEHPSPNAAGAHLFARHGSGRGDLSERAEALLPEKVRGKHRD